LLSPDDDVMASDRGKVQYFVETLVADHFEILMGLYGTSATPRYCGDSYYFGIDASKLKETNNNNNDVLAWEGDVVDVTNSGGATT
jgi:hypothetical protein